MVGEPSILQLQRLLTLVSVFAASRTQTAGLINFFTNHVANCNPRYARLTLQLVSFADYKLFFANSEWRLHSLAFKIAYNCQSPAYTCISSCAAFYHNCESFAGYSQAQQKSLKFGETPNPQHVRNTMNDYQICFATPTLICVLVNGHYLLLASAIARPMANLQPSKLDLSCNDISGPQQAI